MKGQGNAANERIFLAFNLLISPRKYQTLHVNLMPLAFWGSLGLFFLLLCLLCVWFYYIVSDMMAKAETETRNHILEMQESNYLAQQRYMKETAKIRHDFKHTIGTLDALVSAGDLSSVRAYLDDYLALQPTNDTIAFCENPAVNALLNHYMNMAKSAGIPLEWEISMPAWGLSPSGKPRRNMTDWQDFRTMRKSSIQMSC